MNKKNLNNMNTTELNHELLFALISTPIDVNRVRQLIEAGASPDEGIFLAKDSGNPEIIKALVSAGVDVNSSNSSFTQKSTEELVDELCDVLTAPPVNVERVRQLIDDGAFPDENAMSFAIDTGRLELVRILVDAGADVNHIDDEFETPLLWAKNALSHNKLEGAEYNEIVAYLEEMTTQETKDIVEEIMRQNNT